LNIPRGCCNAGLIDEMLPRGGDKTEEYECLLPPFTVVKVKKIVRRGTI